MAKRKIPNKLSRSFHKVGFKLKKHSPEILVVGGIVGVITSAVMACKASTKVNTVLAEHKSHLNDIRLAAENQYEVEEGVVYTPKMAKKDTAIVYGHAALDLVKLYGPSIALGTGSIVAILMSHKIIKGRYLASAASYMALDESFKGYRQRLVERFGEELDNELVYGVKSKEIEETVVNEDGTETTVKKTVDVVGDNPTLYSPFARFYDDGCTGWCKDPQGNLTFLKIQEAQANDKLKAQGYLFLNDVYDMLGIPRIKEGFQAGWIYDEKNPVGDNYVDFGIFNAYSERARAFVNGHERVILLDFNVDGNILEMM